MSFGDGVLYAGCCALTGASATAAWFSPWLLAFVLGAVTVLVVLLLIMWRRGDFQ